MTPEGVNRIAAAMRKAKGTGEILPDERNMWLICIDRIADELWNIPNFNRSKFLTACGVYSSLPREGPFDDQKSPAQDVCADAWTNGSRPPSRSRKQRRP
jgi:hypothetical protein